MHRAIVFKPPIRQPAFQPTVSDPFMNDQFMFDPKLLGFGFEHIISDTMGNHLMLVRKTVFAITPQVDVFAGDEATVPLMAIRRDSPLQFLDRTYTVFDNMGQPIAHMRREQIWSSMFFGSRGRCLGRFFATDAGSSAVAFAEPDSTLMALNWTISAPNGNLYGQWIRRLSLMDKHTLNLSIDIARRLDRRIAVALGILMDCASR